MKQAADMTIFAHGANKSIWVSTYSEACLSRKNPGTIDVYQRILRDFLLWLTEDSGQASLHLNQLTRSTVEMYLASLEEAGWTLEEVAYYLGHVTKKGTPAIQTTARYTQVSREQVKEKLRQIKG
jgi:hypothetical protein